MISMIKNGLKYAGTSIGTVSARDAEEDVLTYTLESSTVISQNFIVNSSTGVISNARRIDREVIRLHNH